MEELTEYNVTDKRAQEKRGDHGREGQHKERVTTLRPSNNKNSEDTKEFI
jgi:hypothetical protein